MTKIFKRILFGIIFIVLIIIVVLFYRKINSDKRESERKRSENNPSQKDPNQPNNDKPTKNPKPTPPADTENWWLTDKEIEFAYSEMRKELGNSPEIQLVSPSAVSAIQESGEISEDLLKVEKAPKKIIFFPINNSDQHETAGAGTHWTLLIAENYGPKVVGFGHYNSAGSAIPDNAMKVAKNFRAKFPSMRDSLFKVYNDYECPQQTNGADCGVFTIAFTRILAQRAKEKIQNAVIKEKDLIFPIADERQKLKIAGFPK